MVIDQTISNLRKALKSCRIAWILMALLVSILSGACSKRTQLPLSFAFYNVENLFDTIDDPQIRDNSHLPDAKIQWNTERYSAKLWNLTQVINAMDSTVPDLLGLCEVENYSVLNDLANHSQVRSAGYRILHQDSPDERGIDVALLYNESVFSPLSTRFINISFPMKPNNKTRDILYTKGLVFERDTLHILINHWTSRWGGKKQSEPFRRHSGRIVRQITDSILQLLPDANILIAGDLNDNPDDLSVSVDLNAQVPGKRIQNNSLYNLSWNRYTRGEGTLYYKSWDMFDQIIVSGSMLKGKNGLLVTTKDQLIIQYEWMLYQPRNGPARPSRTAGRDKYFGGYSDHLPVMIRLRQN